MEFNVWPDSLQGSRLVKGRYREVGWKVSSVRRCKECSWIQRVVCEQSRYLALNWRQGPGPKGSPRAHARVHATPTSTCASASNGRYKLMGQARYVDPKARFGYPFSHSRRYFYLRGTRQHLQRVTHDRRGRRGWGQTPSQSVDSGIREMVDYHAG